MAAPPPPEPATYAELYQSMPDALGGEYQAFLDRFAPDSADAPAQLRDTVLTAGVDVPKVFVYLSGTPPRVQVLHRPTRYAPTLGRPSTWDDSVYAFSTDVGPGNMIGIREWPADAFVRSHLADVPTMAEIDNQCVWKIFCPLFRRLMWCVCKCAIV